MNPSHTSGRVPLPAILAATVLLALAFVATAAASPGLAQAFATPTPLAAPDATKAAQIAATAAVPKPQATGTPDSIGIEGVNAFPVSGPGGRALWVASSYGLRAFIPNEQRHFVAVYEADGAGWKQIAKLELQRADYLGDGSVRQAQIRPDLLWLTVDSGVGAHGGCFDLLSFDGTSLKNQVNGCGESPGAGQILDVNGDGTPEAVLNASDRYVFCYACGVTLVQYNVQRWDGAKFVQAALQRLPDSAAANVRDAANHAVDLAEAGLYKDAVPAAEAALQLAPQDATLQWNAGLIRLTATDRAALTTQSGYPLLQHVFYGDYGAAVDAMRQYTPAHIFNPQTPLISGTVAEQWQGQVAANINTATTAALKVQPDMAAAYFLRAWGAYFMNPNNPSALTDLRQAATLAPNDKLYSASLQYVETSKPVPGVPATGAGDGLQLPLLVFVAGLLLIMASLLVKRIAARGAER